MAKEVEFEWKITLSPQDDEQDFSLTIDVLEPQIGSSTVVKPLGGSVSGDVNLLPIGKGKQLRGKELSAITNVADFDANSNLAAVTFRVNQHEITYRENVASDKGSIIYNVTIKFA